MTERRPPPTAELRLLPEQDLLSVEARARLEGWAEKDRRHFTRLLRDAGSDLQRELLQRALAAAHDAPQLHAFAESIREMSDEALFEACTPDPAKLADRGGAMEALLAAQADPLAALELNRAPRPSRRRPKLPAPRDLPPPLPSERRNHSASTFQEDSEDLSGSSLGRAPGGAQPYAEDLLSEAVKAFGLTYREQKVDGPRLSLARALDAAAVALKKGIPVPIFLGAEAGEHLRCVLLLQLEVAGKIRAFQLHDPFTPETVWVNEGDFLGRVELPLANKRLRRMTGIALPRFSPVIARAARR